jgi:hypothetical protein
VDIVLGVSMTPTTVRMVLVEGAKADGVTVDHDVFDINGNQGSATSSPADQVIAAVLGTQESAGAGGHHLNSTGVTWTDHADAAALRDSLVARGIEDVMLVSELHAAAALAQAVGRAVGYDTTALFLIDRDTATLSVVQTDDGSIVKVLSRNLHDVDAMAVLTEMAAAVDAQDTRPQGMFIVGSGVDVGSVKAHLENLLALPVSAPDEPELALARGAALASAHAPVLEASTVGLAYSQDPDDGTTAGSSYPDLAGAATQLAPVSASEPLSDYVEPEADLDFSTDSRKPFLLVGSALTSIFVVGVVALVISLAVSIRPTVDQRPSPGDSAIIPSSQAPAPPVQEALPVAPPAPPPPAAPPVETIKAPIPVVKEAPQAPAPRQVFVEQAPPAPLAPPPAPAPVELPPAPVAPPPAPAPFIPPPVYRPPVYPPVYNPPPVYIPPKPWRPPVYDENPPWKPWKPWTPPWQQNPPVDEQPAAPYIPAPQNPAPQNPAPQNPAPYYPQQPLYPPSGGGSGSGGSGDYGSGGGGSGGCVLIFCAGGGSGRH